jgi:phage protein U
MYAILGDIKFEGYKGFAEFSGSNETVLSEHAVIEGKPRLQRTGEKLEEISLKFLLHSTYSNPEKELEILQGYRRDGVVLPFVSGDGYTYGDFVLKSINRTLVQTNNEGAIIGIEVELTLVEYFVPGQKAKPANEKLAIKAPAISVTPLMPKPTDPQQIAANLKVINTQSAAMDKELKDAQRVPSKTDRALREAKKRIDRIRDSLAVIEEVGSNTRDVINIYDSMKGQADAVASQTEALAIFVEDGDINSAVGASAQLRNAYGKLSVDAAPVNNLVGIRRDKENPAIDGGTTFDFNFDGTF